jgi:adenosine deaminase
MYNQPEQESHSTMYNHIEWGTEHPQYQQLKRRIVWSKAEKKYIRSWLNQKGTNTLQCRTSCLLAKIREDVSAHKIFHLNHIVDVTRLRHGVRIVEDPEFAVNKKAIFYL